MHMNTLIVSDRAIYGTYVYTGIVSMLIYTYLAARLPRLVFGIGMVTTVDIGVAVGDADVVGLLVLLLCSNAQGYFFISLFCDASTNHSKR